MEVACTRRAARSLQCCCSLRSLRDALATPSHPATLAARCFDCIQALLLFRTRSFLPTPLPLLCSPLLVPLHP